MGCISQTGAWMLIYLQIEENKKGKTPLHGVYLSWAVASPSFSFVAVENKGSLGNISGW